MIDIRDEEKEVWMSGRQKYLRLVFDDGTVIDNDDIVSESMTIEQTLSDENYIRYGKCSAASFSLDIADTAVSFKDKWFNAYLSCGDYTRQLGRYKVYSDKRTDDRRHKSIVAYDAIYMVSNMDCTEWYEALEFPISIKDFRDSFFEFLGITQEESELPNDWIQIEKTIDPASISALTVMESICEINARFGQIGTSGKFRYIDIDNALYPLFPSSDLFPNPALYPRGETHHIITMDEYEQGSFAYEDYEINGVSKVTVREQEGDVGGSAGAGNNIYYVTGNFLLYGQDKGVLDSIAGGILNEICHIVYHPGTVKRMYFSPWTEIGDWVKVIGVADAIKFPILKRTIKGITGIKETYEADGEESVGESSGSILDDIIQLKGRSNVLKRDINETQSAITALEETVDGEVEQLQSQITQNSESITAEVTRATGAESNLSSRITVNAESISAEVSRATEQEGTLSSRITQTANSIASEIERATGEEGNLSSRITQNADSISTEVSRATGEENSLSSRITQTAESITAEISRAEGAESSLSSAITQTAESISQTISATRTELQKYADTAAGTAESNAKSDTDNKLLSYSTTTQMNSAINQKANEITLSVSESIEETRTYAESVASDAENNAKADTTNKLENYSTTTEMNSAINLSKQGILSTVSSNYATKSSLGDIETRVSAAESKITAEAIVNTVTSSTSYQNLSSTVTQTANGFNWLVDGDGQSTQYSISSAGMKFIGDNISVAASKITYTANDYKVIADNVTISGDNIHLDGNTVIGSGFKLGWEKITGHENVLEEGDSDTVSYITEIAEDKITANYIKSLNLEVGNQIKMGSNATISWAKVTNKPDIPTDVNQLSDASGQKWSTTVGENWIKTANVYAQNLQVNAAKINGTLTADKIVTSSFSLNNSIIPDSNRLELWSKQTDVGAEMADNGYFWVRKIQDTSVNNWYGIYKDFAIEKNSTYVLRVWTYGNVEIDLCDSSFSVIKSLYFVNTNPSNPTSVTRYYANTTYTQMRMLIRTNGSTYIKDISFEKADLNFLYTDGTTTIDGGKITAGTIDATKINVSDLFSKTISASGSISVTNSDGHKMTIENGMLVGRNSNGDVVGQLYMDHAIGLRLMGSQDKKVTIWAYPGIEEDHAMLFVSGSANITRIQENGTALSEKYASKSTVDDIPSTYSKKLTVDNLVINNISFTAKEYKSDTASVSKTGYTPIGVVGWTLSGTQSSNTSLSICRISGTTLTYQINHFESTTNPNVNLSVYVLYVKN